MVEDWPQSLDCEEEPFDVYVERVVELLFSDVLEGAHGGDSGVEEDDVEPSEFVLDLIPEGLVVLEVCRVGEEPGGPGAELLDGLIKGILTPAGDDDLGSFGYEALCAGEADAGVSSGDEGDFVFELLHFCLSSRGGFGRWKGKIETMGSGNNFWSGTGSVLGEVVFIFDLEGLEDFTVDWD